MLTMKQNMNIDHQRKMAAILRILDQAGKPLGSTALSRELCAQGIDLKERMVRYYLTLTDKERLTENLGRKGRVITDRGRQELDVGIAIDKVGFVNSRIDELTYRMNFNPDTQSGTVVLNYSIIKSTSTKKTFDEINRVARVLNAGLGMGRYIQIAYPGKTIQNISIPKNHIAIGTMCSVTINGILLHHGISMTNRFGGLLEMRNGQPVRFSQIISYDGSTLDPIEIFIKGKMTSVNQTSLTGTGCITAGFREIPVAALPAAQAIIKRLKQSGLANVLMIGKPNQPLLDIPVSVGRVGLIVPAGLNPIASLEEVGLITTNQALANICPFEQLRPIDAFIPQGYDSFWHTT